MRARVTLLLTALLVAAPLAILCVPTSAANTTPILGPSSSWSLSLDAKAAASSTANAYAELFSYAYYLNYTSSFTYEGVKYIDTPNMAQLATNPLGGIYNKRLSSEAWVNVTLRDDTGLQCACAGSITCTGFSSVTMSFGATWGPPASSSFPNGCQHFFANWTSSQSTAGIFIRITRLATFTVTTPQRWTAAGRNAEVLANLTPLGYPAFSANGTSNSFAQFVGAQAFFLPAPVALGIAWWVPYPAGSWIYSGFSFSSVDTGQVYGGTSYAILSTSFLVGWTNFNVSSAQTYHYEFTALSATGSASTGNSTTTNVTMPQPQPPPLNELVLLMGNVTYGAPYDTASVTWQNLLGYQFNGTYLLEGSWLASAVNVTLLENGVPIPSFYFQVTNTSVLVFPQIFDVPYEQSIQFTAHFTASTSFSFGEILFYINGAAVTVAEVIAAGGIVAAVVAVYAAVRFPATRSERSSLKIALEGVGLMTIFLLLVVSVV